LRSSRALLQELAHKGRAARDDDSVAAHAVQGGHTLAIDKTHAGKIKDEAAAFDLGLFAAALEFCKVSPRYSAFEPKGRLGGVEIAAGDLEHRLSLLAEGALEQGVCPVHRIMRRVMKISAGSRTSHVAGERECVL